MNITLLISKLKKSLFNKKENIIEIEKPTNNNEFYWELYFKHNLIPTAQLDENFNLIHLNEAMINLIKYNTEQNLFLDYIKIDNNLSSTEIKIKLNTERAFIIPINLNYNQKHSAFAYFHKADHHMIISLIDNTKQKDLEVNFAHSQKMQAIGQLAGGIAHDFNNLLTAMIGFCDLLLIKHPAGDPSFPELMQIKQNTVRAMNLIKQLLAFSRKQVLQIKFLDVNEIILGISDLIKRLIGENIELKMNYGRDIGMVKADKGQLEQVIINLAINARDAMPQGGQINIKTYNYEVINNKLPIPDNNHIYHSDDDKITDDNYIIIEISDNGCGINPEYASKIFEPFFSTKEIGSGTGLGLAMVYGIIKQTNGHIYFTSKENEGTRFFIFLKKYHELCQNENSLDVEINQYYTDLSGDQVILLVEDEEPVRLFAITALENKGYKVYAAKSGDDALRLIKTINVKIDLMITDVIMPGINGYKLTEILSESYKDLKVLFISGYTKDNIINELKASNKNYEFLSKPFTLKQLTLMVKKMLN